MTTSNKSNHDELIDFYNAVEERVIELFGSYDRAAAYFDRRGSLDSLWEFAKDRYIEGWHASRVAKMWYGENVGDANARGERVYTPVAHVKSTATHSGRGYDIEPEILAARETRRQQWENASLVKQSDAQLSFSM